MSYINIIHRIAFAANSDVLNTAVEKTAHPRVYHVQSSLSLRENDSADVRLIRCVSTAKHTLHITYCTYRTHRFENTGDPMKMRPVQRSV